MPNQPTNHKWTTAPGWECCIHCGVTKTNWENNKFPHKQSTKEHCRYYTNTNNYPWHPNHQTESPYTAFITAPPELLALAAPIAIYYNRHLANATGVQHDPKIIFSKDQICMTVSYYFPSSSRTTIGTRITLDIINIYTDAHLIGQEPYANFTNYNDPQLYDKIATAIQSIIDLGSREELFHHRDKQRDNALKPTIAPYK